MMPDRESELENELLDARKALSRIRRALGLQRTVPLASFGFDTLATVVEKLATVSSACSVHTVASPSDPQCWECSARSFHKVLMDLARQRDQYLAKLTAIESILGKKDTTA